MNVIERGILLCQGDRILVRDLPESVRRADAPAPPTAPAATPEFMELPLQEARRRVVEQFERKYLEHHLRDARGIVGTVAQRAGINPRTLYEKMRRLGLKKEDFR